MSADFLRRLAVAAGALVTLFAIAALVVSMANNAKRDEQDQRDYRNALLNWNSLQAGCKRSNARTTESNRRIRAHVIDRNVLITFLITAEAARRASGTPSDLRAARHYHALQQREREHVRFKPLPLVKCSLAYPKPQPPQ